MNKVTFKNLGGQEWLASTGEHVDFYKAHQVAGRGSRGWYITEVDGEFDGNRYDTLQEAKARIIRRHNVEQGILLAIASAQKTLDKYASSKVGA